MKNLWILTEERPKIEVLRIILQKLAQDLALTPFIDTLRIVPIVENGNFSFTYKVVGFTSNRVGNVFIKTVSGYSSFVDFLIFFQQEQPNPNTDTPIYAIEETKTDDKESRNTGVYQRCTKFVFIEHFYPNIKKIMLYNLQIEQKDTPTQTSIFGTRLLLTLGVEIIGKALDKNIFYPFKDIKELIEAKAAMRKAPKNNVPISIIQQNDKIEVSGRLEKNGTLAHDPNIGALSIICAVLRKFGWEGCIEIAQHGLSTSQIRSSNKFILICNKLNIKLQGLVLPVANFNAAYWKYDTEGEKLGTIFIHLVVENFTNGYSIFENHAGSEKGYFITRDGTPIPLAKYKDRNKYKNGDKSQIIHIPDLILLDFDRNEIVNIEGKKYQFKADGIIELKNYDAIENQYIKPNYPTFKITRTVVLYGSNADKIIEIEVGFLLNNNGKLILGVKAPPIFIEAIKNLIDFWQ